MSKNEMAATLLIRREESLLKTFCTCDKYTTLFVLGALVLLSEFNWSFLHIYHRSMRVYLSPAVH